MPTHRLAVATTLLTLCLLATSAQASILGRLLAPGAEPWPFWDTADANSSRVLDHSTWQALLDRHLDAAHSSGTNRFHYAALSSADRQQLASYLAALQAVDPRQLNRAEQMAYWINLYNAGTVALVLEHLPGIDSIRDIGRGLFSTGPWDRELFAIAGQRLTLNDVEHRILRPIWQDPRIHYAVNCASLGCPDLAATAFTSARLEAQLQAAAVDFLGSDKAVRLADGTLHLSSIFDWYRGDFPAGRQALQDYLASYRSGPAATALRQHTGPVQHHYNWQLNQP